MTQAIEQYGHPKMTLEQFVREYGRRLAAESLGCTPAALSKAIGTGRTISVEGAGQGRFVATETSPFPSRK